MTNWQAYPRLKLALNLFNEPSWALELEQLKQVEERLARQLAMEERVLEHAASHDLTVDKHAIDKAVAEVREQYPDEESWLATLRQCGLEVAGLREALRRELLVNKVLEQVSAQVEPMTEEAARAYYVDHPSRFMQPERREVRHILITVNDEHPDNSDTQARARISALRDKLLDKPNQFGKLAMRNSECPTALHEGMVGKVSPGQLYPELDEALFQLPVKGISQVLSSPMGYHLIQCLSIHEGGMMPVEEAIPKIIDAQLEHARQKFQRQWLAGLMKQIPLAS